MPAVKKPREKAKDARGTVKKLLERLKRFRLAAAASLLLALVSSGLTLLIPVLVGRGIDCIVEAGRVDLPALVPYLIGIGVSAAAAALAGYLMGLINNRITYGTVRAIRSEAFSHIQRLPLSSLDPRPVGETVSRLIADADQLADGLLLGFSQLFTGLVTIVGTLAFMLSIHPLIALVVVLLSPLSLLVAGFIAKRAYSGFITQAKTRGEATALIDEFTGEQKLIRAFGYESAAKERFGEVNERLRRHSVRAVFISSLTNPSTRFVNSLIYAGVAVLGAFGVISGGLTVGGLSAFLSYANQYTKPFNEISGVIAELQGALACAERLFELIDASEQTPDPVPALSPAADDGSMEFENVDFSYEPERELIKDFSLSVGSGKRIAIVGPTGCGKTTLINLIMRFYDVLGGSISLGGVDTRAMTRHELRSRFGMVLQDTWLGSGTVRENIAMGRPDATEEEIVEAARAAHCDGFIRRLPKGYDTELGEAGGSLSAGQKQLLCIARVMLLRPPMLILDEATSSIDTRTELLVQDAFNKLMEGRTSFIVAHRLSTIRDADLILVMRDGHIVEQGSHLELLEKAGFYSELYETQFAK
ncbi:MAG: ABC transporter ATP-binding protein [Clostridia bacterium]|nr:ABC transporter ATP-binding protein [Clostridia bacterium]